MNVDMMAFITEKDMEFVIILKLLKKLNTSFGQTIVMVTQ